MLLFIITPRPFGKADLLSMLQECSSEVGDRGHIPKRKGDFVCVVWIIAADLSHLPILFPIKGLSYEYLSILWCS